MNQTISRELLTEVLEEIVCYDVKMPTDSFVVLDVVGKGSYKIDMFLLAHKCKEWAYNQGYLIGVDYEKGITVTELKTSTLLNHFDVEFEDFLEFEIKACEWVFKELICKD